MKFNHCLHLLVSFALLTSIHGFYHIPSMQEFDAPNVTGNLRADALYGYSITYLPHSKSLVISAPKADNIGQVFSCPIGTKTCTKIDAISPKDVIREFDNTTYNHDFWFGATVKASSSVLVMCAPRYGDIVDVFAGKQYGTFGRCYSMKESNEKPILMPHISTTDRNDQCSVFENVTDSFGWSMDVLGDRVVVGSPAMSGGRVMAYNNPQSTPKAFNGRKHAKGLVSFNFGYSVAVGNFFTDKLTDLYYAISTPYGEFGDGKILFYSVNSNKRVSIITEKSGDVSTIFGAAICAVRINGPRQYLLVGAPAFTPDSSQGQGYDRGAVYIYTLNRGKKLALTKSLLGKKDGGYFGSTIANLGDLDGDGKEEVAIAAPYEDDGRGAVYLFTGADLLDNEGSISELQRIQPSGFREFGLSLTSLADYDDNGCNEVAIGAPESNKVVLLQCVASVTVNVIAHFPDLQTRKDEGYFMFESCVDVIYPEKPKDIVADLEITVEITHSDARLAPISEKPYVVSLNTKEKSYCQSIQVLTPSEGNYDQMIGYSIKAKLLNDPTLLPTFAPARVTLSKRSRLVTHDSVWAANCKKRGECESKLNAEIQSTMTSPYTSDSSATENITVHVTNTGEVAYGSCVRVHFGDERISVLYAPACTHQSDGQLACIPRAPLKPGDKWDTGAITLQLKYLTNEDKNVTIIADVYNNCKKAAVQTKNKIILLNNDIDGITVKGTTVLGNIVNINRNEANTKKDIEHEYTITNNGLTTWVGLECNIKMVKNPYIKYSNIRVYREDSSYVECELNTMPETADSDEARCNLGDLHSKHNIQVFVPISTVSGELENILQKENVTIQTYIGLFLETKIKSGRVVSTLIYREAVVPLWIILVATLIGLIILFIIFFILYECGCLARKNKEKLHELKRDVKRQSMRRSMMVQNTRTQENLELQSIVENCEGNHESKDVTEQGHTNKSMDNNDKYDKNENTTK